MLAKIVLNQLSNIVTLQIALASPLVQVCLQFGSPFSVILDLCEMLPLGSESCWKAVIQPEGDELHESRFVPMRQITTLVPAAKTALGVLQVWKRGPAAFGLHQIMYAGISGRPGFGRLNQLIHKEIEPNFSGDCKPSERGSVSRRSIARHDVIRYGKASYKSVIAAGHRPALRRHFHPFG